MCSTQLYDLLSGLLIFVSIVGTLILTLWACHKFMPM